MTYKPGILFRVMQKTYGFKRMNTVGLQDEIACIIEAGLVGIVLYVEGFCLQVLLNNKIVFIRYEILVEKCKKYKPRIFVSNYTKNICI